MSQHCEVKQFRAQLPGTEPLKTARPYKVLMTKTYRTDRRRRNHSLTLPAHQFTLYLFSIQQFWRGMSGSVATICVTMFNLTWLNLGRMNSTVCLPDLWTQFIKLSSVLPVSSSSSLLCHIGERKTDEFIV